MNEPTPELDPELDVDWWSSRLVDREIDFADVPPDLRRAVQERSTTFAIQRRTLLRSGVENTVDTSVTNDAIVAALRSPDATVTPLRRRLVPILAVAAASVGVIAMGAAILQPDETPDVVAFESEMVVAGVEITPAVVEQPIDDEKNSPDVDSPESDSATAMAVEEMTAEPPVTDVPSDVLEIADVTELSDWFRSWGDSPPAARAGTSSCNDDRGRLALDVDVRFAGIDAQVYFSPEAGVILLAVSDCSTLASIVP